MISYHIVSLLVHLYLRAAEAFDVTQVLMLAHYVLEVRKVEEVFVRERIH
jgi:hypothetical protein